MKEKIEKLRLKGKIIQASLTDEVRESVSYVEQQIQGKINEIVDFINAVNTESDKFTDKMNEEHIKIWKALKSLKHPSIDTEGTSEKLVRKDVEELGHNSEDIRKLKQQIDAKIEKPLWSCESCRYINESKFDRCGSCGEERRIHPTTEQNKDWEEDIRSYLETYGGGAISIKGNHEQEDLIGIIKSLLEQAKQEQLNEFKETADKLDKRMNEVAIAGGNGVYNKYNDVLSELIRYSK